MSVVRRQLTIVTKVGLKNKCEDGRLLLHFLGNEEMAVDSQTPISLPNQQLAALVDRVLTAGW
jgi:hypothetical protein